MKGESLGLGGRVVVAVDDFFFDFFRVILILVVLFEICAIGNRFIFYEIT